MDSANQRAWTAESSSEAANKLASQLRSELQELKAKYDAANTQLQIYQNADDARKKTATLQKQTARRPTKTPILGDLIDEDEYYVLGHNRLILIRIGDTLLSLPPVAPFLASDVCVFTQRL